MVKYTLLLFAFITGLACSQQNEAKKETASETPAPEAVVDSRTLEQRVNDTSRYLAGQAFSTLNAILTQQVKAVGTDGAVRYCNESALPLTDSVARQHGIQMQRLAYRNRNPLNATSNYERNILVDWEEAVKKNQELKPKIVQNGDQISWYGAITIAQPQCLDCHGLLQEGDILNETLQQIKKHYPNDKAVNFELGDVRGMWKISYPKSFFEKGV